MHSKLQTIIINSINANNQTCFAGIICANEIFIVIYGVIFTMVISLGVYIYGLQNKGEKITLIKNTKIKQVIRYCLIFFSISFLSLPGIIYEFVNFLLVAVVLYNIFKAFTEIFAFNENELSGEMAVRKFKEGVIQDKLKEFENIKIKNDIFKKSVEDKNDISVERFLFDENKDAYHFIRAQNSGFIVDINLNVLSSKEIDGVSSKEIDGVSSKEIDEVFSKKNSYYIPYNISNGAPVAFDSIILGVKKEEGQKIDEERLRSFISISEKYENPTSYLEAEMRTYYSEMFSLIKIEDTKSLELKLEEFSNFVNHFTNRAESYADLIQFINDDIVFPLQRFSFKRTEIDCIREMVSFSLSYVYQSLDKKSIQTFNIFLRNVSHAFYQSFSLSVEKQNEFSDIYFRWLNEIAKYSIKPKIQKGEDYNEYVINFLSSLNGSLKVAFDNKNIGAFSKTLELLNNSFSRENYEHDEDNLLDELVLTKKAVIFGFTSWAYKYYQERKDEDFYKKALAELLVALQKDRVYYYGNVQDDINYYLLVYLKAIKISGEKGSFGWDSWGMPEGVVYTVTIHNDAKNLLIDRILSTIINNQALEIDIKAGSYNDELSLIKEGDQQFDPLFGKNKLSFIATIDLDDEKFALAKAKLYEIFSQLSLKYNEEVKIKLIDQPLDDGKFEKFAEENFKSYEKSRILYRIKKFIKDDVKKVDGFGYNMLLHKEQFVEDTNIHYSNESQFGENLAQSEDNKILESIYKDFEDIVAIKKDKIWKNIQAEENLSAIVIWTNGHFFIEDTNPDNFKPHWKEDDLGEDRGYHYQGSINGTPVYFVYKLKEYKKYADTLFIFKQDPFSVKEFEIIEDQNIDQANFKFKKSEKNCLNLSVTNLSSLNEERTKIVEKWIELNPGSIADKNAEIEKLKTKVVFKFYKGLSIGDVKVIDSNTKIFHITK
ncbi:MAG: hypothetical protein WC545_03960 [Patescibacteria group bacterium]